MKQTIDSLLNWLQDIGIHLTLIQKLTASLVVVFLIVILRIVLIRIVNRRTEDVNKRYHWRKGITYATTFIAFVIIGRFWFTGVQSLATFLGLFAAGLTIALQDPIVNFAGWFFILWRRPFEVGNRIEIGSHRGDVIDQRLFTFSVMEIGKWVDSDQSTGRVIHIPNGIIFKQSLANYHRGFSHIWNEIPVLITFESNWKRAKQVLTEIIEEQAAPFAEKAQRNLEIAAKRSMIVYHKLTPIVWLTVKDSGVLLTIRYLCDPRARRSTEQKIWEEILEAFSKHEDLDLAYPTMRYVHDGGT